MKIVDLFAGPGGWDQGLTDLGFGGTVVGLEWDTAACQTAMAAGHLRVQADVAQYPTITTAAFGKGVWRMRPGAQANAAVRHDDEPAPTIAFGHDAASWCWEHPAPTVSSGGTATGGAEVFANAATREAMGNIRVSVEEAGVLQSFPADYPWRGTKTKQYEQVGNAIPPGLASVVLRPLVMPALDRA